MRELLCKAAVPSFCIITLNVTRENRIPFELAADPFYSKQNMTEQERRVADLRSGKSTLKEHKLIEADE